MAIQSLYSYPYAIDIPYEYIYVYTIWKDMTDGQSMIHDDVMEGEGKSTHPHLLPIISPGFRSIQISPLFL